MKVRDTSTFETVFGVAFLFAMIAWGTITLLVGCSSSPAEQAPPTPAVRKVTQDTGRFSVLSHGTFYAGYDDNRREVLVVTDNKTGIQYLAITGCGTTELRTVSDGETSTTKEE